MSSNFKTRSAAKIIIDGERGGRILVVIKRGGILKLRLGKFYDILLDVLRSSEAKILIL